LRLRDRRRIVIRRSFRLLPANRWAANYFQAPAKFGLPRAGNSRPGGVAVFRLSRSTHRVRIKDDAISGESGCDSRFINGGVNVIAAAVSGFVAESMQSASQTFCAHTPLIVGWRWMRTSDVALTSSLSRKLQPNKR
jgi:hypothetical protein